MTIAVRRLTAELATPLGTYTAGTEVYVLETGGGRTKVCLDPDMQHHGRCHTATVPNDRLTRATTSFRDPIIAARRAALDEARPNRREVG